MRTANGVPEATNLKVSIALRRRIYVVFERYLKATLKSFAVVTAESPNRKNYIHANKTFSGE